jgi:hypothetical protein
MAGSHVVVVFGCAIVVVSSSEYFLFGTTRHNCDTQHVTVTSPVVRSCRTSNRSFPQILSMPPQYDPLTQEDDSPIDDDDITHNNAAHGGIIPRPAVYYGEGPFDAPSSDDDEDAIIEKDRTNPLNRAEHGDLPGSLDSGLYVGGPKVRSHELLA